MRLLRAAATVVLAWGAGASLVQIAHAQTAPAWVPVAGRTWNAGLAGPASGPVQSVWFSRDGNRLFVQTESGRVFETTAAPGSANVQGWKLNSTDVVPVHPARPTELTRPESGILISTSGTRRYSLTRTNIFGSDDGRSWVNLTGLDGHSILGDGFSALVVSPADSSDIVAANQQGVWRSLDGGLSWQGINEDLPNMTARSLAGQRTIVMADERQASLTAGKWTLIDGVAPEALLRRTLAARSGRATSAASQSGPVIYAGAADGRVAVSVDNGATWTESQDAIGANAGPVDHIWIDPANPQAALAVAGVHLYRTTSGGRFWDDVTGTLAVGEIHGIAADSSAGVVYAATDHGVYSGRVSLNAADLVPARWAPISGDLPIATAWDARLNSDGTLTVLLDGYGVYEAPAPHRAQAPRIVNGADMTDRAAAPGSLISVLGANVKQARSGQNSYKILLAADQSSQLQVPFEVMPGTLQLAIETSNGFWTAPLNVKQAAPAIFVDADGTPMVLDAASGLVIDSGTALRAGSLVQVLATGLGRVTPEWPTGVPAPVDSPPAVAAAVTAYLDGTPIRVTRATLAPTLIGNYLVELQLPSIVDRGVGELRIVVNGEESNRVKIYLESGALVQ